MCSRLPRFIFSSRRRDEPAGRSRQVGALGLGDTGGGAAGGVGGGATGEGGATIAAATGGCGAAAAPETGEGVAGADGEDEDEGVGLDWGPSEDIYASSKRFV